MDVRADPEIIRYNERYKALATFSAALAIVAGSVAQFLDANGSNFLAVFGVGVGVAFLISGWHLRVLIQSES